MAFYANLQLAAEILISNHKITIEQVEEAFRKGKESYLWKIVYQEVLKLDPHHLAELVVLARGFNSNGSEVTSLYDFHRGAYLPTYASGQELLWILATTAVIAKIADVVNTHLYKTLECFSLNGSQAVLYYKSSNVDPWLSTFEFVEVDGALYRQETEMLLLSVALGDGLITQDIVDGKRINTRLPRNFFGTATVARILRNDQSF